ncbi:Non-specific serine/threonine protein kinase protein [Dioscorea alata]|uniref:Non-specific serine/threonine protein kinase protein n=1 Tax=Dioscorea alata TaxID=55571 RepID=A0ACB7WE12_DIOAL|nr:Non-specific serine/threonine protein kinase protein [Dioscorea alata]
MKLKIQQHITLMVMVMVIIFLPYSISISISPSLSPSQSPSPSPLDPKQLKALHFLGLSSHNPCSNPSPHHNATSCDSSHPFRHIISLTLSNCTSLPSLSLSLRSFSSLSSLSFINCSVPPPRHLPSSLHSFTSNSSLRHLSSLLLSRLHNLTSISILSVPITGSGLPLILSQMPHLLSLTISQSNLSGPLPSSLFSLPLTHLDLSSNNLNGTLPIFPASSTHLQYLNLENNNFHGVIPYNSSFITRLQLFKVSGNPNLCYNHSILSSKLSLGVAKCDQYGLPISPPPAADSPRKSNSDDSLDDEDDGSLKSTNGEHHGGGGPNKLVLGVAITLSFLVFLVIFLLCISKACGCR